MNDTLRVDGKDVTLEQIAIDHSDPFYGDDLTITALVAEVRRLRAVEEKYTAAQAQARAAPPIQRTEATMLSRLDAIRARLAAATRMHDKWHAVGNTAWFHPDDCETHKPYAQYVDYVIAMGDRGATADFIAHAPADLLALLAVAEAAADLDPCETLGSWYCLTHHTQIPCGGDRLREAVAALTTKEID